MNKQTYIEGDLGERFCIEVHEDDFYKCISSGSKDATKDLVFQHIATKKIEKVEVKTQVEMMEMGKASIEVADTDPRYGEKGYKPYTLPDGTPAFETGLLASDDDVIYFFTDTISFFNISANILKAYVERHKNKIHHFTNTDSAYGLTIDIDTLKDYSTWKNVHHTPYSVLQRRENISQWKEMLKSLKEEGDKS